MRTFFKVFQTSQGEELVRHALSTNGQDSKTDFKVDSVKRRVRGGPVQIPSTMPKPVQILLGSNEELSNRSRPVTRHNSDCTRRQNRQEVEEHANCNADVLEGETV
jgi:hypothetical protein